MASFLSFLLGEKKNRQRRQGAPVDHPGARAQPAAMPEPDYLPALQRELVA